MCVAVFKKCECGAKTVQFHLRDNLLSPEVLTRLFCPACPGDHPFEKANMLNDNGWVIEYDMILARSIIIKTKLLEEAQVTPTYIFDQGYCAWLEIYPGEKGDIKEEKDKILELQKTDQQLYLKEIISWNINRLATLKTAGWRKAQNA